MSRHPRRLSHGRFVLLTVVALALGACGSTSTTATPTNSGATKAPVTNLGAAASNFEKVDSYRFTMTLAGGMFTSMLSMLPTSSAAGNVPFTIGGTISVKPVKAADVIMVGLHIVEIGGYDYMDVGGSGSFVQIPISGTGLAARFSPTAIFSTEIDSSSVGGYDKVGSGSKNGVQADHYRASDAGLARLGSIAGIAGATWSADVWTARDGGYPVSVAIVAEVANNTIAYEVLFDITNVGDPANSVTVPTHVAGA